MRVLAISVEIPFPPRGGGRTRTYHLLHALAKKHDVTLVGFTYGHTFDQAPFPIRIVDVPWELSSLYKEMYSDDSTRSQRAYETLAREVDLPWFVSYFQSEAMKEAIVRIAGDSFDLVLIEDTDMAQYAPLLSANTPKVLDFQNVYSLMALRAIESKLSTEREAAELEAKRTVEFERRVTAYAQLCLTCSNLEADNVRELLHGERVEVVPNGVDTEFFRPATKPMKRGYLLFTGSMNYAPNVEAVEYFVRDVLPQVVARAPETHLHIVGMNPGPAVRQLASEFVTVHGNVPDVRPYFAIASVVVAPILHGGGTRLKILEAAASGKAVVTTPIGVEGLGFTNGTNIIVANNAAEFVDNVLELVDDSERCVELGRQARQVVSQYDWRLIETQFLTLLERFAEENR